MRLLLGCLIAAASLIAVGRAASADYVIYYAIVTCDPGKHAATIVLGQSFSEPVPPQPPEARQLNAAPTASQSFNLQDGAGPGDCHLTPDLLLRAKVGAGRAMPYGECGADPAVWLNVWVGKRKWLSGFQIAGRCAKDVLAEIVVTPDAIKYCTWPDPELNGNDPELKDNGGAETCTVKEAADLPTEIDSEEFRYDSSAEPGTVKVEYAEDMELCSAVVTKQDNEFGHPDWHVHVPKEVDAKLFTDYEGGLYDASGGFSHDLLDIDNSGTARMVYGFHPSNHANDADMYFLSPGAAVDQAWPKVSEQMLYQGSTYIFPLSFGKCREHPCGPGDEPEEGSIGFRHYPLEIRFRYLHETPFVWRGATYFLLNSMDMGTENIYAVLKPHPSGFDEICILNKVPEPF